jgi:hypothetical protein
MVPCQHQQPLKDVLASCPVALTRPSTALSLALIMGSLPPVLCTLYAATMGARSQGLGWAICSRPLWRSGTGVPARTGGDSRCSQQSGLSSSVAQLQVSVWQEQGLL